MGQIYEKYFTVNLFYGKKAFIEKPVALHCYEVASIKRLFLIRVDLTWHDLSNTIKSKHHREEFFKKFYITGTANKY